MRENMDDHGYVVGAALFAGVLPQNTQCSVVRVPDIPNVVPPQGVSAGVPGCRRGRLSCEILPQRFDSPHFIP